MAINQLSFMPGFGADSQAETEEQRRQREEQERIERESAMLAGLPGVSPSAVNPLTMSPEDAANTEVSSTQIKTYGDGSQEEILKRQIPAAGPVDPMAAQAPDPAMMAPNPLAESQQNLNVLNPQLTPEQQQQAAQIEAMAAQQAGAAQPMNMQQPMAQPQPQTMSMAQQAAAGLPQQQPQPQPMAQAAPIAPDQAMPEIGMPPTPGPGVQVASAAPSAGVAEAAQAAQAQAAPAAPAAPAWITAANEAGNDFDKLIQVAAQFPESRGALKEKMRTALEGQRKEKEAQDIVLAAAQGDAKAQNQLQQALRPETGRKKEEITTGDYVKAYLYARLGLNELASEAQKKILGKSTKFGQVTLGNSNWQVETDAQGNIVGARDNQGTVATENTLNKLRAESRAVSTATPPSATSTRIRDSKGTEWSQVPTPQGIKFYDNSGRAGVPEGRTVPIAVGSDVELKNQMQLNELQNKLAFAGPTASAAEREKIIAESEARYGPLSEAYKASVRGVAPQPVGTALVATAPAMAAPAPAPAPAMAAPAPAPAPAATTARPPAAGPVSPAAIAAPAPAPAPAAQPSIGGGGAGGATPAARESASATSRAATDAAIQQRKELAVAEQKPAAIARGTDAATTVKNQSFADRTYSLMKPINDAILQSTGSTLGAGVDAVAAAIGKSTEGSKAIARLNVLSYGILSNIPRFEGPQSDIDVQMYKQAAGDFNNRKLPVEDRLAALDALRTILQRYDTAGKNDWTFGSAAQSQGTGTTQSGNKFKRVQ